MSVGSVHDEPCDPKGQLAFERKGAACLKTDWQNYLPACLNSPLFFSAAVDMKNMENWLRWPCDGKMAPRILVLLFTVNLQCKSGSLCATAGKIGPVLAAFIKESQKASMRAPLQLWTTFTACFCLVLARLSRTPSTRRNPGGKTFTSSRRPLSVWDCLAKRILGPSIPTGRKVVPSPRPDPRRL